MRSIYTKLVALILVLIVALMAVVGAFLMTGVRNFYINEFYTRMQEVFASADVAADLRAAADEEGAAELVRGGGGVGLWRGGHGERRVRRPGRGRREPSP